MLLLPDKDKGIWFMPGVGKGILSPRSADDEGSSRGHRKIDREQKKRERILLLAITSIGGDRHEIRVRGFSPLRGSQ